MYRSGSEGKSFQLSEQQKSFFSSSVHVGPWIYLFGTASNQTMDLLLLPLLF